jgi:hypothetical protein
MKGELSLRLHPAGPRRRALRMLILVDRVDAETAATVEYALSLRPEWVSGVQVAFSAGRAARVGRDWHARFGAEVPLLTVDPVNGRLSDSLSPVVNSELPETQRPVLILVPERRRCTSRLRPRRDPATLTKTFEQVADVWMVWIAAA